MAPKSSYRISIVDDDSTEMAMFWMKRSLLSIESVEKMCAGILRKCVSVMCIMLIRIVMGSLYICVCVCDLKNQVCVCVCVIGVVGGDDDDI